jgi:hypothetical protein
MVSALKKTVLTEGLKLSPWVARRMPNRPCPFAVHAPETGHSLAPRAIIYAVTARLSVP